MKPHGSKRTASTRPSILDNYFSCWKDVLYRSNPNKSIKSRGENIEKKILKQLQLHNCDKVEHPGDLRKPNRQEEKNNSSSQKHRVIIHSPTQVKPFFLLLGSFDLFSSFSHLYSVCRHCFIQLLCLYCDKNHRLGTL